MTNQAHGERFKRAVAMWSQLSQSYTGLQHVTRHVRGMIRLELLQDTSSDKAQQWPSRRSA